jgi:hypothetical protein
MKFISLKPLDLVALFITLVTIAIFAYFVYGNTGEEQMVYVKAVEGVWVFSLDDNTSITVKGPIGETKVVIDNGGARVVYSDCRQQICVSSGTISRPGSWIACLPNRVFVRIEAEKDDTIDASAY